MKWNRFINKRVSYNTLSSIAKLSAITAVSLLLVDVANAGTLGQIQETANTLAGKSGAAPWEDGLTALQRSLTGPTANAIAAIAIAIFGLGLATGSNNAIIHRGSQIGLGVSIAFGGWKWISAAMGITAGALL